MRWLKELKNPSKKCERIGHKKKIRHRTGIMTCGMWFAITGYRYSNAVAIRFRETIYVCARCKENIEKPQYVIIADIQRLTIPTEMYDIFLEKGVLYY